MNILVAYYSWSGNTKELAELIQSNINSSIFAIEPAIPYTQNYNELVIQAKSEINCRYTPELKETVFDIEKYDTVFLGTPNWWGSLPPTVRSFINFHNLSEKKIIPFITHGGGGVQNIITEIEELCPNCTIEKNPWVGYGNRTAGIQGWLNDLNLKRL